MQKIAVFELIGSVGNFDARFIVRYCQKRFQKLVTVLIG